MRRIGGKLFLGFLCMAALAAGLIWLIQAGIMKDSYMTERVAAVDEAVRSAATGSPEGYAALEERWNIRLLELDGSGAVQYVSQGMPMRGMLLRLCQSGEAPAADGRAHELTAMAGGARYALLGRKLSGGGTLYAVFSLADVTEAAHILEKQLWVITAALLAASVLLALILSRAFAAPVRRITAAARALAAGRLETRVKVSSRDEIGELAGALNDLGGELLKTEELRRELIANVSHELRAPLAVIQGYAETVRDVTWPLEDRRSAQLTAIAEEAARLSRIVTDILDYSRLQAGVDGAAPRELPLRPALEAAVRRHAPAAEAAGVTLSLTCTDTATRFDPAKFDRVMDNLISNAVRHADAGTQITVKAAPAGTACRVSVQNTGDPIPPDALPRIWDRYWRAGGAASGRRQGAGLGLAIVKSILEQHGAPYGVSSENRTTVFWFEVPVVR